MNTLKLMVGTNFDPTLPDYFRMLNEMYLHKGCQVHEVYGSIRGLKVFGSARPDFRVPDLNLDEFTTEIRKYRDAGIHVNYTENTPLISKQHLDLNDVERKIRFLVDAGVTRITVAHPLAMELANERIPIEISTIYAVRSVYQLRTLKERVGSINKFCFDVSKNRDFDLIKKLKKEADELGVDLELLANEFCITDCVDRAQCYLDHAQISDDSEAAMFSRYPMGRCTQIRRDTIEWIRARFIIPQSMAWYRDMLGIEFFKITGRTHPTPYIKWIAEQYMAQDYHGNLLELWADVKNIKRVAKGAVDFLPAKDYIDASQFGPDFLWQYWHDKRLSTDVDYEYEFLKQYL